MKLRIPRKRSAPYVRTGLCVMAMWVLGTVSVQAQDMQTQPVDASQAVDLSILPAKADTLRVIGAGPFLLRAFIVPESLHLVVNGRENNPMDYDLDGREGVITLRGVAQDSSLTIVARYQYIPLEIAGSYQRWERNGRLTEGGSPTTSPTSSTRQSTLVTRGRVSRGVLTGSNRNARIESGLQLQVEGEVAPGVTLDAELTDEDTPLVPEGVTRQFDQFDRIRIGFESRHGRVDLGDFDALLQHTRYAQLRRKLQGAGVTTSSLKPQINAISAVKVSAGAAITRGQFHSIDLDIKEGIQGPYRLSGAAGERFILVLPGTERVFLDGILLERGTEQDYEMNYSLGELTFTPRHLMGPDRRVRIEYEYTTNRYTRTLSFAETQLDFGKNPGAPWARLVAGGIREADGAAFVDELGLSSADSALVAASADGVVQVDGAVEVIYDPEALFTHYTREVTGADEQIYVVYTGGSAPEEPVYRVPFSFVGEGIGAYRRIPSQSGGIAYEWTGQGQGSYAAIRTLPVPSSKTLGELRLQVLGIPGIRVEAGLAGTRRDRNRLSNEGAASISDASWDVTVSTSPVSLLNRWSARFDGSVEHRGGNFQTFERIRSVEFARDWGLPIQESNPLGALLEGADESIARGAFSLVSTDSSSVEMAIEQLELGDHVSAVRLGATARFLLDGRMVIATKASRSTADRETVDPFSTERTSAWLRIARPETVTGWRPFVEGEMDRWRSTGALLGGLSLAEQDRRRPYLAFRAGLDRSWTTHQVRIGTTHRAEEAMEFDGRRLDAHQILTGQGSWIYSPSSRLRSAATLGWRWASTQGNPAHEIPSQGNDLTSGSGLDSGDASDTRSLLVGWDGRVRDPGFGTIQWAYHVRSEQTAAMQEIYIRTGPERGSYVWVDSNNDGQIQLDEYFPETTPGEGEYARTLFPSDSLESVTTAEARLSYSYLPRSEGASWRNVLLQTTIDVRETSRSDDRADIYLLRSSALRQAGETINGRIRVAQRIGLFPLRRDRDVEIRLLKTASLAELANGSETGSTLEGSLSLSETVNPSVDLTLESLLRHDEAGSQRFTSRQYDISRWEIRPGTVLRRGDGRLQTEFMISRAEERVTGASVATYRLPVDLYWTRANATWRAGGERSSSVISDGAPIGLQLFELTEGRGAGPSWMWHLHLDIRLTDIISATLRYDGRRPSGVDTIHTGRFHLTARF